MTTQTASPLVQYITALAGMAGEDSVSAHILKNGREFQSGKFTERQRQIIRTIRWADRREKECWHNAQAEALLLAEHERDGLRYVEGYIDPGVGIGLDHAWLSLGGLVVDPTIRTDAEGGRVVGTIPEGWAYYGVEMAPSACEHMRIHRWAEPLIDGPACGWPMVPGRRHITEERQRSRQKRKGGNNHERRDHHRDRLSKSVPER